MPAGSGARMGSGILLVQLHVGRRDGERAAVGHGVPSVDRQVHDNLLELPTVSFDLTQRRIETRDEFNVFSDEAAHHAVQIGQDGVQVEHHRFQNLLATEREQLPRERRRALTRLSNFFHVLPSRIVRRKRFEQDLAVARMTVSSC